MEDQYEVAERAFADHDFGDVTIEGDAGWETDGEDRLIQKFYYKDLDTQDVDSSVATFCINFVPGTSKIFNAYVNW